MVHMTDSPSDCQKLLTITPFAPEHAHHFDRLNRWWIAKYFWLEPLDEDLLTKPKEIIIDRGGEVWFMAMDGGIVAACALLATDDPRVFEFSKLGVDHHAKGQRIGQKLLHHCVVRAKARGGHTLQIFSHTSLKTACQLYADEGFIEIPMTAAERQRYKRSDIMLKLPLTTSAASLIAQEFARAAG